MTNRGSFVCLNYAMRDNARVSTQSLKVTYRARLNLIFGLPSPTLHEESNGEDHDYHHHQEFH
jgi:hypothetical protein